MKPPRLVALTSGDLQDARDGERLLRRFAGLRSAGLEGCLLREPGLDDRDLLELARGLREVFKGAWFGVHDKLHVGLAAGADAVHLGFRSLTPKAARRALGSNELQIGLSTHAEDSPADWAGADYLFHGPVFETPSKVGLVDPVGLDGLGAALGQRTDPEVPVLALGGINGKNLGSVLETGVHGAAVLGCVNHGEACLDSLAELLGSF